MPYIRPDLRPTFDPYIDALAEEIAKLASQQGSDVAVAGLLDYCIFRLGLKVMPERRYWAMNMIVGVFRNAADEFLRRVVNPYEDEKIRENGDLL